MSIKYYRTELFSALEKAFNNSDKPLSFNDLISFVNSQNLSFNKSNFYRQLNKMQVSDKIQVINTTQGQMWEKARLSSHQHLECQKCNTISCVDIDEKITNDIAKNQQFKISTINFLGICRNCIQRTATN
jgi:Fe2+ or Zn2+ uptake regulation protein